MSDDFFDDISPKGAYDIGDSMGRYRTEMQALRAYELGEIEMWLEFVEPKSLEEWDEWEAKYGDIEEFENRWKV